MYERFTDGARKVMQLANHEAQRLHHEYIGSEHILLGLLTENGVAANVLTNLGVSLRKIRLEVEKIVRSGPDLPTTDKLPQTPRAKKVIEYSIEEAKNLNHNYVGTEHLLLGLLREQEGVAAQVLMNLGISLEKVRAEVLNLLGHGLEDRARSGAGKSGQAKTPALDSFGHDLTELARQEKTSRLLAWNEQLERVIQVLGRRTGNNPLLVGESGIGTISIVEGLAQRIASGDPPKSFGRRIVALDLARLNSNVKARSQIEERWMAILIELRQSPEIILFLDHLNLFLNRGSDVLRNGLLAGEIRCVAGITPQQYRTSNLLDGPFEHQFQPILVPPVSEEETVAILRDLRTRLENFHRVQITDTAIQAAVELSGRFMSGRCLPDRALEVLDEAGARIRFQILAPPPEFQELDAELQRLTQAKEEEVAAQHFSKAAELRDQADELKKKKETLALQWQVQSHALDARVDAGVVADVVSMMSRIPRRWIRVAAEVADRPFWMELEVRLGQRVIGQEQALTELARVVRRRGAGLRQRNRPLGAFVFAGPSGVGKTLLAQCLAQELFGNPNALVRITPSRLSGGSWGSINPESGNQLSEQFQRQPCGIVLLDAVEQLQPDGWHLLLQVVEEGRLSLGAGHSIDLNTSILILETNAGFAAGSREPAAELGHVVRPEFLSRVDSVIGFRSLSHNDLEKVLALELKEVQEQLKRRGWGLLLTDEAKTYLIDRGSASVSGAWGLRRAIENSLVIPLGEALLMGDLTGRGTLTARIRKAGAGRELTFEVSSKESV